MRAKRYFWNTKKHKELDEKMGLNKRGAGPLAKLAEACGMDINIGGTKGLAFVRITALLNDFDKVMPPKMKPLVVYDYLSNERIHRLGRCRFGVN